VAAARGRLVELGQGAGRLLHRRELARARERLALAEAAAELARQRADRAADRERGGRVWRQATTLLSAYRDRYGFTDPERALGPEPRRADVVQRQAWLDARQATERVHAKQRMSREQRLDRRERAHGDQPPTRPARSDRTRWPSTEERERRGRERKAG